MLCAQALKEIDRTIAKYPPEHKRSAVMAALAVAQDEHGWLSTEVMRYVADYLDMPAIAVQEVATFYSMYRTAPAGKYMITLCTNLPCALSGAQSAAEHLKCKLGVDFNRTTPDGKFTLKEGECMGACGDAPVLLVNHKRMCGFMTSDRIDRLLKELSANCSEQASGK
ncbi:NADH-quinone oxidoreductase subunit NuoE, partial [Candidatus Glomeribacter gigasporarum]|uniref:NADH-quinone oxidoreductase subunit NuoE n=1 Tax=Candidatus Glomeribacter gigasporarum TaxID=132144 RepID=UPI0009D9D883